METIFDMRNYIQSRRRKGKTAAEIQKDLEAHGYDYHAARALTMLHWETNPEEIEV